MNFVFITQGAEIQLFYVTPLKGHLSFKAKNSWSLIGQKIEWFYCINFVCNLQPLVDVTIICLEAFSM